MPSKRSIPTTCKQCGVRFLGLPMTPSRLAKGWGGYCSVDCARLAPVHMESIVKHGESATPEYRVWSSIKSRCLNPSHRAYRNYGGRGITIAKEWADDFLAFLVHVGRRPSNRHSIDRINNQLGYQPGNIRWSTDIEQNRNRRNNHILTLNGESHCVAEWALITGIKSKTLHMRLSKGWAIERVLTTPITR
jgi:hypothetical protein